MSDVFHAFIGCAKHERAGKIAMFTMRGAIMTNEFDSTKNPAGACADRGVALAAADESARNIPALVSEVYDDAPASLRTKLLECLLRPVGPLAIVTIAAGAFAHLLYRLRVDGIPVSMEDVTRVSAEHVLELARYVEQCSPHALLRFGALIASTPIGVASVSGTALVVALSALRRRWSGKSLG